MPYVGPAPSNRLASAADIEAGAVDSSELASGAVDIAHLSATGTASSSTFLRGDNSFASAGLSGVTTAGGNVTITSGNLIVASGNGVDFSAAEDSSGTMSSELLDFYEEGSFTPTLGTYSGTAPTVTYTTQSGRYTRVGRMITLYFAIGTSSYTGGSSPTYIIVEGLPFEVSAANKYAVGTVDWEYVELDDVLGAGVVDSVCARLHDGTPEGLILAISQSGGAGNFIVWDDWPSGSTGWFQASITYSH